MNSLFGAVIGASALALAAPPRSARSALPLSPPAENLSLASTPNPDAAEIRIGNAISFCPALSCVDSPSDLPDVPTVSFFDHQRTSMLLSSRTRDDGHSQEQTLAVTTTIGTGYLKPYAARAAYTIGDNTVVGGAAYRAVVTGITGADSAPPATRPTAAQGGNHEFKDGSVTWRWINDASIDAKLGSYFETSVIPGAGNAWGAAFNYHFSAIPKAGNFFPGVEMDYANDSGTPCALGITDCTALRLAMTGSSATEGLQVTGNVTNNGTSNPYSSIWAIRVNGDYVASQSAVEVDAASPVGLGFGLSGIGGTSHSVATIEDVSASPTTLSIGGHHSLAGIVEQSISQNGIALNGTYTGAQIVGKGFILDAAGKLTASAIAAGGFQGALMTPKTSAAQCSPGQFEDDVEYHYVCVAKNRWKRVALSSF